MILIFDVFRQGLTALMPSPASALASPPPGGRMGLAPVRCAADPRACQYVF